MRCGESSPRQGSSGPAAFRSVLPLVAWFFPALAAVLLSSVTGAGAQWVQYADETATRLSATASLGVSDVDEKDYAWGDVDNDGDIDLVVVRKQPNTTAGKRVNVLFLNENGVLTDRTSLFAADSDVPGDQGFLTPTNDRDVQLVDVDGDGWLDIVTAVTISDGDPKTIGHPRIYHNKGLDGLGAWLGFRYEEARIPTMLSYSGQSGFNPRFCSVAVGDVNGDGSADLWFGDYDSAGVGGGVPQPAGADYNDRLLINDGTGYFTDASQSRFAGTITIPGSSAQPFVVSAFGAAGAIADMNGDGVKDIVKQTSLNSPLYVGIAYNDPAQEGFFDTYEVAIQQAPYFVSVGDLNQDNKPDMVVTMDGADKFLLNQGNGVDGLANFTSFSFSFDAASDDGFGSNSLITDLNNDGWNDVLITDVDVDTPGCSRRMHIYRNLGGQPGGNVTLQEQTTGTGCATSAGNPPTCFVASIPSDKLEGVHDVAVFDINQDGWKDLVIGRCAGTSVWVNQPPNGLSFSYPQGLPFLVPPGVAYTFQVQVSGFGGAVPQPGTGKMFLSFQGAPLSQYPITDLGGNQYEVTLPVSSNCGDSYRFYFTADSTTPTTFFDPPTAPGQQYKAIAATGTTVSYQDDFEGAATGWTVVNDATLTSGAWEVAVPIGTIAGTGQQAAPDQDAQPATSSVNAYVTQNGLPGGTAGASDVDGGPTDLISPVINLANNDATISYFRWFYGSTGDDFTVSVSNNGGTTWLPVETVPPTGSNSWQVSTFRVSDYLAPTANVKVRFRVNDVSPGTVVEGGVDVFSVESFVCTAGQASGSVPDGMTVPGTPLTASLEPNGDLTLSWGGSCQTGDTDYEIYEGTLGSFASHTSKLCSTGGLTTATITPVTGGTYYLIVPGNGANEGSYGRDGMGAERPAGAGQCLPQSIVACQ